MPKTDDLAAKMLRRVRRAEQAALSAARTAVKGEVEDAGTGFTILRRQDSPITRLLDKGRIGPEELHAAEDIATAFAAMAGALMLHPMNLERTDRAASPFEPARTTDAVTRYKRWAAVWSARSRRGDPTLEIVIAAVIDERALRAIEGGLGIRNGRAAEALGAALRDYAARAGWASGACAQRWLVGDVGVFKLRRLRPIMTPLGLARKWDAEFAA